MKTERKGDLHKKIFILLSILIILTGCAKQIREKEYLEETFDIAKTQEDLYFMLQDFQKQDFINEFDLSKLDTYEEDIKAFSDDIKIFKKIKAPESLQSFHKQFIEGLVAAEDMLDSGILFLKDKNPKLSSKMLESRDKMKSAMTSAMNETSFIDIALEYIDFDVED